MSDKPQKEFLHVDVEPGTIDTSTLASLHNEGWESYAPAQWDSVSRVWRVLLYKDVEAPAPVTTPPATPALIAEVVQTDEAQTDEAPAPTPEPVTEETHIEAESTDKLNEDSPVVIVAPILTASLNLADEVLRIRADKSLLPMEKANEIKRVGDEIALAKARVAGMQTWDAEQILDIFACYDVHIYNAEYDIRLLAQSGGDMPKLQAKCVMKPFAKIYGQWDDYHQSYTYQPLGKACEYYDIHNPYPHRALGDALTARLVWLAMTKKAVPA